MDDKILSAETISAIVASVTHQGSKPLQAIEAERLLNAIARAQSGVPTGPSQSKNAQDTH